MNWMTNQQITLHPLLEMQACNSPPRYSFAPVGTFMSKPSSWLSTISRSCFLIIVGLLAFLSQEWRETWNCRRSLLNGRMDRRTGKWTGRRTSLKIKSWQNYHHQRRMDELINTFFFWKVKTNRKINSRPMLKNTIIGSFSGGSSTGFQSGISLSCYEIYKGSNLMYPLTM